VHDYVQFLETMLAEKNHHLKIVHINLLQVLEDYLDSRNVIDKALKMQKIKGDEALLKALKGQLHMDKFAPYLTKVCDADEQRIIFISGIGSV
jgi:hypothetical protein